MFVWRGWGIITVALLILAFLGAFYVHDILAIRGAYIAPAFLLVGAILNWFFGTWMNHNTVRPHTFFWAPMQWGSLFFVALAFLLYRLYH